jgi:hypothetical protein
MAEEQTGRDRLRGKQLQVRLSSTEIARTKALAGQYRRTDSAFVRDLLDHVARNKPVLKITPASAADDDDRSGHLAVRMTDDEKARAKALAMDYGSDNVSAFIRDLIVYVHEHRPVLRLGPKGAVPSEPVLAAPSKELAVTAG